MPSTPGWVVTHLAQVAPPAAAPLYHQPIPERPRPLLQPPCTSQRLHLRISLPAPPPRFSHTACSATRSMAALGLPATSCSGSAARQPCGVHAQAAQPAAVGALGGPRTRPACCSGLPSSAPAAALPRRGEGRPPCTPAAAPVARRRQRGSGSSSSVVAHVFPFDQAWSPDINAAVSPDWQCFLDTSAEVKTATERPPPPGDVTGRSGSGVLPPPMHAWHAPVQALVQGADSCTQP